MGCLYGVAQSRTQLRRLSSSSSSSWWQESRSWGLESWLTAGWSAPGWDLAADSSTLGVALGGGDFSVYTGGARVQSRPHGLNYWWVLGAYEHSFLVSVLMTKWRKAKYKLRRYSDSSREMKEGRKSFLHGFCTRGLIVYCAQQIMYLSLKDDSEFLEGKYSAEAEWLVFYF